MSGAVVLHIICLVQFAFYRYGGTEVQLAVFFKSVCMIYLEQERKFSVFLHITLQAVERYLHYIVCVFFSETEERRWGGKRERHQHRKRQGGVLGRQECVFLLPFLLVPQTPPQGQKCLN